MNPKRVIAGFAAATGAAIYLTGIGLLWVAKQWGSPTRVPTPQEQARIILLMDDLNAARGWTD